MLTRDVVVDISGNFLLLLYLPDNKTHLENHEYTQSLTWPQNLNFSFSFTSPRVL